MSCSDHRMMKMHQMNPDRARLVWESAAGPVLVEEMNEAHLRAALAFADREGFKSEALPAMRARLEMGGNGHVL